MSFLHLNHDLTPVGLPAGKVVCIGRNYVAHAKELGNEVPKRPVIFMKPTTSLVNWKDRVAVPVDLGECHHELELALLINKELKNATVEQSADAIGGVTLALDLTLRDLQNELKQKSHPWELAKAFDGACPLAPWHPLPSVEWLDSARLLLKINGDVRQQGDSQLMLWPPLQLVSYISQFFTLQPGDVVLTGTPAGVDKLSPGDRMEASLEGLMSVESEVIEFG